MIMVIIIIKYISTCAKLNKGQKKKKKNCMDYFQHKCNIGIYVAYWCKQNDHEIQGTRTDTQKERKKNTRVHIN